jgi:putative aldouronate transport system permease protein
MKTTKKGRWSELRLLVRKDLSRHWELYLFVLPAVLYYLIFHYYPMYGVQIAFRNYLPTLGFLDSPWVGLQHFRRFFHSFHFWTLLKNTLGISVYQLAVSFPLPIVFALMLNEIRHTWFKRTVQTITYAPHFISTVVIVGMLLLFLSPSNGIVNMLIKALGGEPIHFMTKPEYFKTIYVLSGAWQRTGWSTIIYLAVLSGVDPCLYEAASIDGASKLQKILNIDIPSILPTAIILLILNCGHMMNVGFEKVYLMQNPLNMIASDVISTYVYRAGLLGAEFSFATAVGLFNSIVNLILLLTVNRLAKKLGRQGLW